MRRRAVALPLLVLASALTAPGHGQPSADCRRLFSLLRSQNRNELIYLACLSRGALDNERPLRALWKLHEDGGREEPLTGLEERFAYGVILRAVSAEVVEFSLRALPDRSLFARRDGGAFVGAAPDAPRLERIYVALERGLFPSVDHVDLVLVRPDGSELVERVTPP